MSAAHSMNTNVQYPFNILLLVQYVVSFRKYKQCAVCSVCVCMCVCKGISLNVIYERKYLLIHTLGEGADMIIFNGII